MAVDPVENDPLSIQTHDVIFEFKTAEAHVLANDLVRGCSVGIFVRPELEEVGMLLPVDFNRQGVEVRLLRGPEGRLFHGDGDFGPPVAGEFSLSADQLPAFACQGKAVLTGPGGKHGDDQVRIPVAVIEQCFNLQVLDMAGRNRIEIDIPEDAGEAEEVLILSPGSGREAEDHGRELVRTFPVDIFRQVELRRGEGVLAVADVVAVQPEGHGRLRPLEGDADRAPLPLFTFWQCEVLGVHGHGIEDGRQVSGL